jgi:hypothetical protein
MNPSSRTRVPRRVLGTRHPGRDATPSGASQIRDPVSAPHYFVMQRAWDDSECLARDDGK